MNKEVINHYIVAHRDDAALTFGGAILSHSLKGEQNRIYVVNGFDGTLNDQFARGLIDQDKEILKYLERLAKSSKNEELFASILSELKENTPNLVKLGITVRKLEEVSASNALNAELIEYYFPGASPFRNYTKVNQAKSPELTLDIENQTKLLFGDDLEGIKQIQSLHKEYGFENLNLSAPLKDVIHFIESHPESHHNLYFLSGIGGHPDHLVLAKSSEILSRKKLSNTSVFVGQDLPYATVFEWFQYTHLSLPKLRKQILDITELLPKKVSIVMDCYKSQFTEEDLRIFEQFHYLNYAMLHKDFYMNDYQNLFTGNTDAIEVCYLV